MTNLPSSALKLLCLLVTLTAIAERGTITHVDTTLLGAGAVLFLMLMEAQQRAEAGESWSQAGRWLEALLGPSILPFYILLFGALIAAFQGPVPTPHQPVRYSIPSSPSATYPYAGLRQPGMPDVGLPNRGPQPSPLAPGAQGQAPGPMGNPGAGAGPRSAVQGFGPPTAHPLVPKSGPSASLPGSPSSIQRPPQGLQHGPAQAPATSAAPAPSPNAAPPATSAPAAPPPQTK